MLKFKESVPYVSLPPTQPPRHLLVTSATAWPSSRAPFQAAFWWIGTIVRGTSGQVWEYCSSILLCLDQALNSCPTRLSSREKRNIAQRCAMRWIDCGRVRCSTRSDCKAATVLRRCFEQSNQIHWKRLWCEHLRIAFLKLFFYFIFRPSSDIQLEVGGWMSFAVVPPDHFDLLTQLIPRRLYEIKFVIHSFCFEDS